MDTLLAACIGIGTPTVAIAFSLIGLAVGLALGRIRSYTHSIQNHGEEQISRALRHHFIAPNYHLMNHITLRMRDATTQIDHILVSRFGVFVIETKHYNGWIFTNGKRAKWTQVLFKSSFQFQNPIYQNARHVRAVRELLDFLPSDCIK
ncbi:nuclease-related domain-containing protein [Cupriavidus pauculus]|uniref:NERD domain-containing protein n=1 Tax=Cupriavidus pauculus TaxID=82633 RepID=A0A2N5CB77_9BURK|nr:hypothetical protein CYJ10_16600 [Cupriavidus pauculus]